MKEYSEEYFRVLFAAHNDNNSWQITIAKTSDNDKKISRKHTLHH